MSPAAVRLLTTLRARLSRVASDRLDAPARAGDSLAVYVEDSAQLADTIAALEEEARIAADPMGEVRAWLVADLHAMGHAGAANEVGRLPATAQALAQAARGLTGYEAEMLSPKTRAALGIGGVE